ncbi:benign gonial cell neoplasm protein [Eupeodes corollae]|uniref:benign gonial cell neoplasm protein n=1 Tax=Eupeodes corollae TaxID=290404 RepID=UPI002491025F|nr:benign gonial cell neoplasm protein [Eupeodes corollae]
MDILTYEYISENLMKLVNNNICCVCFFGPFYHIGDRAYKQIYNFSLKIQNHIVNGHTFRRIYNSRCCHCIDTQRPFLLNETSKKDVLYYLKHCNSLGFYQDGLPFSLFKSSRLNPALPANRFSIEPLRPNTYYSPTLSGDMVPESWRLYPFKQELLKKLRQNRVLVVNGDTSLEKSTAVPLIIVEDSVAKNFYCKILCVETDNLTAITNSTFLADHLNERIGSRVGFQVYLQSRVCDNTNIIYTTAVFFLRVLMGQDTNESFRYITHVVLSDIHLHHAYKDICMKELKIILPHYPHLKVILLSDSTDNKSFLSYFGEGEEFSIIAQLNKVNIYNLEEIIDLIKLAPSTSQVDDIITTKRTKDSDIADKALEYYDALGNESAWNNLIYLINSEQISVNYHHSKNGYTAIMAAVKHDNPFHVRWLLNNENENQLYQENLKFNTLQYAILINSYNCIAALTNDVDITKYELKPPSIEFDLIIKLIHFITNNLEFGNILIFLPSYYHLLKLNYAILKNQFLGKIHQEIRIYLLYASMKAEQLQQILFDKAKIILATEVAECIFYLNDITYVIDTGRVSREKYNLEFKHNESKTEWVSQESLRRRSLIASRYKDGYCFQMISRKIFNKLQAMCPPELHYIPINRISLTVKLLRPSNMVTQYFQDTIIQPPKAHIEHSIEFLKTIETFDSTLEVTWLGCRLIDVPINLELGKCLVMSILFKCLDPVLTIMSFLTYSKSLKLIKQNITEKNVNSFCCADESFSDHLEFLELYQIWQNEKRTKIGTDILISDEETFILNGILENVCEIRTNLVGALRSSQLIHNQGILSMHSINLKANNWAIIKAAIAAGLYPKFCMINPTYNNIKSKSSKLYIDATSNLHPMKLQKVKSSPLSDWIVYYNESNHLTFSSISNCTLISSACVALFAGKAEMNSKNLVFVKDRAGYFIDENIWLITDIQSALLSFKLRQLFYRAYMDYLQTCADIEKWKKPNESNSFFNVLSKILLEEDKSAGFSQPNRVGNRPKAIANKFTTEFEFFSNSNRMDLKKQSSELKTSHHTFNMLGREFFLINIFSFHQSLKSFWKLPTKDIVNDPHLKVISEMASKEKLIYILVCSATKKRITNIALLKYENGEFVLKNCFKINIPLHEIIITCTALNVSLPPLTPDGIPHKIDKRVGEIILDLW